MTGSTAALLQQAAQLHRLGRLADAERLYRAALREQPKNFDALHLLGMLTMQQGRLDEAVELVSSAVKRNPVSGDALTLLGTILLTLNRGEEALGYFDRAVVAQPGNIDALYNRAVALGQLGRWPQALAGYDQVVAAQPRHAEAWFNRGNVLAQLKRYEEAIESLDRALVLAPNNPDALNNRGNALAALGQHEAALISFDRALALKPNHIDALSNRATALKSLGRCEEALAICGQALALKPDHVNTLVTRGNVLHALARYAEALASYDRALVAAPADIEIVKNRVITLLRLKQAAEALANAESLVAIDRSNATAYFYRGCALQELTRDREAVCDYEKVIELQPDHAEAHYNLGTTLQALDRHAEAIPHFVMASKLRSDYIDAEWNASTSYLCLGRFTEGWEWYEHRWAPHIRGTSPREYSQALWDGRYVPGVLFVWGEQGPGDQVMYSSIISELNQYAERVVIEVDPRLVKLFARSFPKMEVVGYGPNLYAGRIDVHEPIGSLPRHLRRSWHAFPRRERGYLVPDANRVQQLRERLASDGRRIIGLTWISRNPKVGQFKSAQLRDFESLFKLPGYRFVDLQYGDTEEERESIEREYGVQVEHFDDIDNMNDFDGLAALICACDAVLTVSSTTAHLAGAVGARTWVMVPFGRGHFWYWFQDRPASPWYPRVQVRRLGQGQPWSDLIASLTPEITAAVENARNPSASAQKN